MSDDLILLITFISKAKTLDKVVLKVKHGMNDGRLKDYEYYNEKDVWEDYKKLLPLHVVSFIDFVVSVEEIFESSEV